VDDVTDMAEERHGYGLLRLKRIVIPASVEVIGNRAFSQCTCLVSLTFETGSVLREIGKYAFAETGL
jgi:hypothetical protein